MQLLPKAAHPLHNALIDEKRIELALVLARQHQYLVFKAVIFDI